MLCKALKIDMTIHSLTILMMHMPRPRKKPGKTSFHASKAEKEGACCYPREKGEGPVSQYYSLNNVNQQLDEIYDNIIAKPKPSNTQIGKLVTQALDLSKRAMTIADPTDEIDKRTISSIRAKTKTVVEAAKEVVKN